MPELDLHLPELLTADEKANDSGLIFPAIETSENLAACNVLKVTYGRSRTLKLLQDIIHSSPGLHPLVVSILVVPSNPDAHASADPLLR
jgi:hypothetical protein